MRVGPPARISFASSSDRCSTSPPPTVPSTVPSSQTSILAPAPRGAEPELAKTVQSTERFPASATSIIFSVRSFIANPPFSWEPLILILD